MKEAWRSIQRKNITNIAYLGKYLQLDASSMEKLIQRANFPLNLPIRLAAKIQKNCLHDPIFLQFVPLKKEKEKHPLFLADPVEDQSFCKTSKLLKKYKTRALLLCTSACAMHCRYCFRKNYPYETKNFDFTQEMQMIQEDQNLQEIILSGGDPLSLGNSALYNLLCELDQIKHLKRIRFHTRFPVGIPERIDKDFLSLLCKIKKQVIFILHTNHPLELDVDVLTSMKKIQCLGIPILTQTVLLKGVNDNLELLKELCEILIDHGIIPYYLHQLDQVTGSAHFDVKKEKITVTIIANLKYCFFASSVSIKIT